MTIIIAALGILALLGIAENHKTIRWEWRHGLGGLLGYILKMLAVGIIVVALSIWVISIV